ncbi:hypothetical protein BO79DRAFT_218513 [Aspergillus costaricaensis CBS 115574]|uniref:Uncharacterized protein n=1 Tax=Aspergillus costaricaensis CBS 115574 TaxID=1448317 RepID=A0ACD1IDL1_9EURO|nr:hypothetical protein BO79DRAFT_218513 [Aspergillus costaricaensis CBS 115574]RAK88184.1 hypothetical protein BO79DRAFT_218513 [Aspergillus costaricaensis CBS 115574]
MAVGVLYRKRGLGFRRRSPSSHRAADITTHRQDTNTAQQQQQQCKPPTHPSPINPLDTYYLVPTTYYSQLTLQAKKEFCSGGSGDVIGWDGWRDGGIQEGVVMIVLAWVGLMLMLIIGGWDCSIAFTIIFLRNNSSMRGMWRRDKWWALSCNDDNYVNIGEVLLSSD